MTTIKTELHPRNPHRGLYDFKELIKACPDLAEFVAKNKYGNESIDFAKPLAVKMLNKAILKLFYNIDWDLPDDFLCPPIPGRADYIHYIADLIGSPNDKKTHVLDIGVGANCIYPLIGHKSYGWNFVGTDIESRSLEVAKETIKKNHLEDVIKLRLQPSSSHIFKDIIETGEVFDISMCNPPFHTSANEAKLGTLRKNKNLG